jgi:uncharacterized RDD family membrane protein YckC
MEDLLDHQKPAPQRLDFGSRFGANLIEGLIIAGVMLLVMVVVVVKNYTPDYMQSQFPNDMKIYFNQGIQLLTLVIWVFELFTGLTLAKLVMGQRVGDLEGNPANSSQLFIRGGLKGIPKILSFVAIYFYNPLTIVSSVVSWIFLLGCLTAIMAHRQAFHDMIAKTAVYKKNDLRTIN